ncbi:MAG: Holliday junction resolvase Hjc [Nanoarchaeota archaeon]|nr:Holliday junction resolvase Hjc [Nanoarchaeota archaeon]
MSNKAKGSRVERELLGVFSKNGWRALRVAGSGVNDESPCDVIVGKIGRRPCAIEAKSSKKNRIYISKSQIEDFILFANMMGLQPIIAVRFNYEGWIFLDPSLLENSGKNWVVSLEKAKGEGKRFGQFFEN